MVHTIRAFARVFPFFCFFSLVGAQSPFASNVDTSRKSEKLDLIEFTMVNDSPRMGEEVDLFFRVTTALWPEEKYRAFFKIKVNSSFEDVDQISENLFQVTYADTFSIGNYQVKAELWIEDRVAASEIRIQITELEILIANLTSDINYESDPDILADLRLQRDDANAQKRSFETLLRGTQKHLKTENFTFAVQN